MAYKTLLQAQMIRGLIHEYGVPTHIWIADTDEPKGIVRILWQSDSPIGNRELFVNPDGSRLSWRTIDANGDDGEYLDAPLVDGQKGD